ncbi:ribitol 5-phosphate transferase FKRP-like [Argiope bruennichi]|uniref:Fukutin-related protein like n=1 Tax=Argiope bruennichi TaxID=94029 RepID=A0A8T0FD49_ARGBR|nr:ribitol 5-phosphate transferase FKRP-like [Argiope bruennichi]KAF8789217.1 Fukutin-related protein like [Argiope bruennichi]
MRILTWKALMFAAFLTNLMIAAIMWSYIDFQCDCSNFQWKHTSYISSTLEKHKEESSIQNDTESQLSNKIAIIIRDFEFFENDIPETVKSILSVLPSVKIFIITDKTPYPPLEFFDNDKQNVRLINLKPSLTKPLDSPDPFSVIDKEHIIVFPDSVRLSEITQISGLLEEHYKDPDKIIAARVEGDDSVCLALNISLRYWTIKYGKNTHNSNCNALEGTHVFLVTKALLLHFAFPFSQPFSTALFIQATLLKIKTKVAIDITFSRSKQLFTDPHAKWKHELFQKQRKEIMYQDFGIKKIIYPASKVEWHGCNKNTARCFGSVINNMPDYLFEGRWTPPCCLENLRKTARYVFGILEKCGVRYWLEGGSLLGAVRTGDIIPWDYDVDIGIYKEDIQKCEWLKNSLLQSIVDTQGFVWEKAHEGEFIRVQFSQTNHLHVDIFPFYSRNGIMTKDTWFTDHKQDTEFPEYFLKPLHLIKFVGMTVSAPNRFKEFLEYKFGQGVIENPEYPNPKVMKFSRKST